MALDRVTLSVFGVLLGLLVVLALLAWGLWELAGWFLR
jgi:hypothetical protein